MGWAHRKVSSTTTPGLSGPPHTNLLPELHWRCQRLAPNFRADRADIGLTVVENVECFGMTTSPTPRAIRDSHLRHFQIPKLYGRRSSQNRLFKNSIP